MEKPLGPLYLRKFGTTGEIAPGHTVPGHTHNQDHVTFFNEGTWRLWIWSPLVNAEGEPTIIEGKAQFVVTSQIERDGPFEFLVPAHEKHDLTFVGCIVPPWMEQYLSLMPSDKADEFRNSYLKTPGRYTCVFAHYTPQGDPSQTGTGWHEAYR